MGRLGTPPRSSRWTAGCHREAHRRDERIRHSGSRRLSSLRHSRPIICARKLVSDLTRPRPCPLQTGFPARLPPAHSNVLSVSVAAVDLQPLPKFAPSVESCLNALQGVGSVVYVVRSYARVAVVGVEVGVRVPCSVCLGNPGTSRWLRTALGQVLALVAIWGALEQHPVLLAGRHGRDPLAENLRGREFRLPLLK